MASYRLALVSRIARKMRTVRRASNFGIAEILASVRILGILTIAGIVAGMGATPANAQDQSIKERVTSPAGLPKLPQFISTLTPGTNRPPSVLASTEDLKITEPLPGLPLNYKITFREFMGYLQDSNISLAAQRFNIPIAQAQLKAARTYPDPTFQSGYGGDVSDERQVSTYAGQLSETILLGGKIKARTNAATETLALSRAQLADFLRNLRVQAANTFIDGLTQLLILQRKSLALTRAQQLVELNEEQLAKKEVREDDVLRARIAELEAESDLISSVSALHETLANLSLLLGSQQRDGLLRPVGNLDIPVRAFTLDDLVARAVSSRSDVIAASNALETARAQYRLAQVNRIPDLTIGGVYQHFTRVTNPINPSPAWDSAGLTLSIPLPFSNLNNGNLQAANYTQLQAGVALQATKLQAQADVRIAYERYVLAVAAVKEFEGEILHDADSVYKARLFKLEEGKNTLVDVLNAHAAINQIYIDYYNALSEQAKALVALESSAGIWDIDF
jgi:outer membrane protein, heavy metal efflux system